MFITILLFIAVIALSCAGAKLSRMCGGGAPHLPVSLETWLFALPWGIAGAILGASFLPLSFWIFSSSVVGFVVSFFGAYLGKRLGHGQYFDLGKSREANPEKLDVIVKFFMGKDYADKPSIKRDFVGLSLTGLVVSLPLSILALCAGHFLFAFILLLTATLKGVCYLIPRFYDKQTRYVLSKLGVSFDGESGHTEPGEWINGFVQTLGASAYIAFLILLLI